MGQVVIDFVDGVKVVRMAREDKRNALGSSLVTELIDALRRACGEGLGIVLTGSGKIFSAGLDLVEILGFGELGKANEYFVKFKELVTTLVNCEVPTVAFVNGSAYGMGMELLYLVDYVVSVRDAEFSLPGTRYGMAPPLTLSLGPQLLGALRTRLLLNPDYKLSANEALEWGLVNEVVDDLSTGLRRSVEVAKELTKVPKVTFNIVRRFFLRDLVRDSLHRIEAILFSLAGASLDPDVKERLRSFVERRRP